MPKGTLAHLLVENGTYDDGDYEYDDEDEHWESWEEKEAFKDALRWLNKEVDASSLGDIADILGLSDTEEE